MYDNILLPNQKKLLPFIESFHREYYLVGGTAIALQIGHRESIDFDMFKKNNVNISKIALRIKSYNLDYKLIYKDANSFHLIIDGVKITFFQYPFDIPTKVRFGKLQMPNLLHLAAMKAYAIGRRAKWKDYVDLYFILNQHFSIEEICDASEAIFGSLFSTKLFKQQLCYFDDIDYQEEVAYCQTPIADDVIKNYLINIATQSM